MQKKRERQDTISAPRKAKVLIADDHSLIVEVVGQFLENSGQFEYRESNSIKEVLEALAEEEHFDVILLDVRMPGVGGLDTFSRVMERANGTPVVLFSGQVGARFVEAAVKLGVRGLIPKSMNAKSLVSALNLIKAWSKDEYSRPAAYRVNGRVTVYDSGVDTAPCISENLDLTTLGRLRKS